MTAERLPTSALRVSVRMTPKEDTEGVRITLKVFWKTTRFWTDSDILDYHQNAPTIMMSLLKEKYWDGEGSIHGSKFTCEDFAVRVLCEFASQRGLPVCLVTGAATYRNMELYNPEAHDHLVIHISEIHLKSIGYERPVFDVDQKSRQKKSF